MNPGDQLGPYEIIEPLGAGGMGEVYRAHDPRLDRDVAIKVLPEDFAADPERLARFEREAKLLAQLNHANIATIHGLEEADSTRFIAMECVEGETLAQRLASSGRIDVGEALDIARQIAEALEAAHESGIIHRDLKPANVKITPDGKAKVLDFGLAKAWDLTAASESAAGSAGTSPDPSHSPTMMDATRTGVILGTAAYMSPEQAKGKLVGRRCDVWAFGCVLYEMLTGHGAFTGEDVTEVLASVIRDEPSAQDLPAGTPTPIRRLLRRCFEKDPLARLDSMAAAKLEIDDALTNAADAPAEPIPAGGPWKVIAGLGWGAAIMLVALAVWIAPGPETPRGAIRYRMTVPLEDGLVSNYGTNFAISPDATFYVYASGIDGTPRLYRQGFDELEATSIPGSADAHTPFFSPNGDRVAFAGNGSGLRIASLTGAAPVTLLESGVLRGGGDWGDDGYIYFSAAPDAGLKRIPADASGPAEVESLTELDVDAGEMRHMMPQLLPNGAGVIFTIARGGRYDRERMEIALLDLATREYRGLRQGLTARITDTGQLLVVQADGSLVAYPFDAEQLDVTGPPTPVLEGIGIERFATVDFDISANGTIMYGTRSADTALSEIVWVERDGTPSPIQPGWVGLFRDLSLSPDGDHLAVGIVQADNFDQQVWVKNLANGAITKVSSTGDRSVALAWTADGARVIFAANSGESRGIYGVRSDGTGGAEQLVSAAGFISRASLWEDWNWLVYSVDGDIYGIRTFEGPTTPVALVDTEFAESRPTISPQGDWLAYASDESGRQQVYLSPFPNPELRRETVSVNGGTNPRWSRDGRELFFQSNGQLLAVDVLPGSTPRIENRRTLFSLDDYGSSFDVSLDSQRFLMERYVEGTQTGLEVIVVVHNFFEEMERTLAAGR